jgi:peptide deformylase
LTERVLLLGDPRLREPSEHVAEVEDPEVARDAAGLAATLEAFRKENGFGRALSAPQIGVRRRMIAFHLPPVDDGEDAPRPSGRFVAHNPEITWTSRETITMFDDCMSFPWLLVRVRRHRSVSLRYTDASDNQIDWPKLPLGFSELVQHEIDHLDGVLAVDRAVDRFALVSREEYARTPQLFRGQVDYAIGE